jgi:hypothetical protein
LYETYTLGALGKIREMKALGEASQEQLVKYASAGIEYLQVLNKYNPCDFYVSRKTQLEGLIEGLPLEVRFTLVKWVNNAEGFFEAGKLANVEVWAYNGSEPPIHNDYKNDKKFKDLVGKSNNFTQLGTTDSEGIADVQLNRKSLPKGLFFRPIGYDDKIKILYMDLDELLIQSKGNYNKRRIRLKMFTAY